MKLIHFLLFFMGFFSFAEDDVLDVPESSTSAVVDIQVDVSAGEQEPFQAEAQEVVPEGSAPAAEALEEDLQTNEPSAPQEVVQEEKLEQPVQEGESEEIKSLKLKIKAYTPDYKYTGEGKKDPFSKPGALKDITTLPEERLHPVEQDSIDNIRLKAIIWGRDGVVPRALFEIQNKTYTLTKNDRIGQEGALIARIETSRVWAMKPVTDPATGQVRFEPYEKTLKTSSGPSAKETELFYER